MDIITILGTALGAAWTSGINLYATVAVLGLLQRYGFVSRLPGGLEVLDNWWIIGVALFLYDFFVLAPRRSFQEAEGTRETRAGVVPREA